MRMLSVIQDLILARSQEMLSLNIGLALEWKSIDPQ